MRQGLSHGLEKASELRNNTVWIEDRLQSPETRIVSLWQLKNHVGGDSQARGEAQRSQAIFESPDGFRARYGEMPNPIFLGLHRDQAYFAVDLGEEIRPGIVPEEFKELRPVVADLPAIDASILAHARAMVYWHRQNRFCGRCGSPTRSASSGHVLTCTSSPCGIQHFPRTDSAIIVLVTRGELCLLGNGSQWPPGRFSTLAGFVEPGESLEDAVKREVFEEAGVKVDEAHYFGSQPWPFPASLMLGFRATTRDEATRADAEEMREVRWFTRAEIRELSASGEITLPPPISIARALINGWLEKSS